MGRAPVGKLPPRFWIRSRMPQHSVSPAGRWFKVQPGLPRGFGFLVSIQSWHIKTKSIEGKNKVSGSLYYFQKNMAGMFQKSRIISNLDIKE